MSKHKQKNPRDRWRFPREGDTPVVAIYESEELEMCRMADAIGHTETGGTLHGLLTPAGNAQVVLAVPAGGKALRRPAEFTLDVEHTRAVDERLRSEFGIVVVGRWHSHHGFFAEPSSQDERTGRSLFEKNALPEFVEIILSFASGHERGRCIRMSTYVYRRDSKGETVLEPARVRVIPCLSPFRERLAGGRILGEPGSATCGSFPRDRVIIENQVDGRDGETQPVELPQALVDQIQDLPEAARAGAEIDMTDDGDLAVVSLPISVPTTLRVTYSLERVTPRCVHVDRPAGKPRRVLKSVDLDTRGLDLAGILAAAVRQLGCRPSDGDGPAESRGPANVCDDLRSVAYDGGSGHGDL